MAKARDTLKKQEAGGTPESAKLDALKKSVGEAEKSVASLKEKSQTLTRDKLEPVKGKKEELTKELEALRDRIALAETGHLGLAEKLKLMEDKKKKSDARLKVVKDAFAKPMDLNFAHFDLPFVLRVKKAPFVFEGLPLLNSSPANPPFCLSRSIGIMISRIPSPCADFAQGGQGHNLEKSEYRQEREPR